MATQSASTVPQLGEMLRYWRHERGKSQLDLSLDTGISQRHLSFVESGRSVPSRDFLSTVSDALNIPLRERNVLLLASGYAPLYSEQSMDAKQMAIVTQETILFNDTVWNNICYGRPGLPQERVEAAAKAALAHDFILELPEAYDTPVGERGTALSGGQRQRIAIARALMANPRILIFDEATSALDYESERIIQDNLGRICKGRTVFIVAHRLSTIRNADTILVLDRGQLAEQGTHNELMTRPGIYHHLFSQQLGGVSHAVA